MYYKNKYKLNIENKLDDLNDIKISLLGNIVLHRSEIPLDQNISIPFVIINPVKNHKYFWKQNKYNNLSLYSYNEPVNVFEEYYKEKSSDPKQVYVYDFMEGITYYDDYINSTEKFCNECNAIRFNNNNNIITFNNIQNNKYGYVLFDYLKDQEQTLNNIDDSNFLMIISNKEYKFNNFNIIKI